MENSSVRRDGCACQSTCRRLHHGRAGQKRLLLLLSSLLLGHRHLHPASNLSQLHCNLVPACQRGERQRQNSKHPFVGQPQVRVAHLLVGFPTLLDDGNGTAAAAHARVPNNPRSCRADHAVVHSQKHLAITDSIEKRRGRERKIGRRHHGHELRARRCEALGDGRGENWVREDVVGNQGGQDQRGLGRPSFRPDDQGDRALGPLLDAIL
mmetsp:Transcript_8348/g.20641  ORF Transcript_8348/g.20641 Transcript_8348/m.20641 type:complete len:210 (+) Transcript_8348:358-987(+)